MTDAPLVGIDTNVLVYAHGFDNGPRRTMAVRILAALGPSRGVVPAQAVGELAAVLTRKFRLTRSEAAQYCRTVMARHHIVAASTEAFAAALDLSGTHQLQFCDALILATAAEAGCRILLSEDMADGFVWRGCTVANPFAETHHPLLADALRPD